MHAPLAWIDGRLTDANTEPTRGTALRETLRLAGGRITFLEQHLARLWRGVERLELDGPRWEPEEALLELAAALGEPPAPSSTWALRLVLGHATLSVTARAVEPLPEAGVRAALVGPQVDSRAPHAGAKTTDRAAHERARAEAHALGAWEALLVNERGELAEGAVTNLFLVLDGALATPPLASGCVAGVARGALLADLGRAPLNDRTGREIPCAERALDAGALARASEVFLTNAVRGVVPLVELLGPDAPGRSLPGARGPVLRAVRQRFSRLEEDGARSARPPRPRA